MKKSLITLIHLGYWIIFSLLLFLLFCFSVILGGKYNEAYKIALLSRWIYLMIGFAIIPGLISFYSSYSFLFTSFFQKKKLIVCFMLSIFISIFATLIGSLMLSFILFNAKFMFTDGLRSAIPEMLIISVGAFLNGVIGLVLKGFITSYADIKIKEELNRKNYEMELSLIKSQINPHFLFNTINNIDMLIQTDAKKASVFLNKLSEIMRFMLYETKTENILLTKELNYIEKYIDLQKIRTANPHFVNYNIIGNISKIMIAPMLLFPFVENAFKHTCKINEGTAINILVNTKNNKIIFECENIFSVKVKSNSNIGGLGNELIKKRLRLLYPNNHLLKISTEKNFYKISLVINCNDY